MNEVARLAHRHAAKSVMWRWLYELEDGQAQWQGAEVGQLERVLNLYEAHLAARPDQRSAYLDALFFPERDGEAWAKGYAEVVWDVVWRPAPEKGAYPVALKKFGASVGTLPIMDGEQSFCECKVKRIMNAIWGTVMPLMLAGKPRSEIIVDARVTRPCNLDREGQWVSQYFAGDGDVAMGSSQKVSLLCPYTTSRVKIPARAADCTHLEVFDLMAFADQALHPDALAYHFKCPICGRAMYLGTIYISTYFAHILQEAEVHLPNANAVEVNKDGRFRFMVTDARAGATSRGANAAEEVECIDLT